MGEGYTVVRLSVIPSATLFIPLPLHRKCVGGGGGGRNILFSGFRHSVSPTSAQYLGKEFMEFDQI